MDAQQKKAWSLVATLFVEMFFVHGAYIILPLYLVPVEKAMRWTRVRSSSLNTVAAFSTAAVGMPITGWLIDLIDARFVMTAGILFLSAGFVMASQAHSFAPLAFAYFLIGVGDAASTVSPCAVVVSNWFPPERRGTAIGIALAGMSAGGMVLYIVVDRFIALWGWRVGYAVMPVPIILLILPLVLWQIRSRPRAAERSASSAPLDLPGVEVAQALRLRSFWLLGFVQFVFQLAVFATVTHAIPYLTSAGFSRTIAVRVLGIATGLAGLGKILMGLLADRVTAHVALSLDLLINALGVVLMLFVAHRFMLVSWTVVWGVTIIAPLALTPIVVTECFGLKRLGSLLGLLSLFAALGGLCGPMPMGWLYDHLHSYRFGLEIVAGLLIIAGISALGCTPTEQSLTAQAKIAADAVAQQAS
jgi:MFS family permease